MKPHRDKTAVAVDQVERAPLGLPVSASRQGGELVASFVNPRHDAAVSVECALEGASAQSAAARILHHPDLNGFNSFTQPERIVPQPHPVTARGGKIALELPPLSVATASVRLG